MQSTPVQPLAYAGNLTPALGRVARIGALFAIIGGGVCAASALLWLTLRTKLTPNMSMSMWLADALGPAGKWVHEGVIVSFGAIGAGLAVVGAMALRGRPMPRLLMSAALALVVLLLIDRAGPLVNLATSTGKDTGPRFTELLVEGLLQEIDSVLFFSLVAAACMSGHRENSPSHWSAPGRPAPGTAIIVIGVLFLSLLLGSQAGLRLRAIAIQPTSNDPNVQYDPTIHIGGDDIEKCLAMTLHGAIILSGMSASVYAVYWTVRPGSARPLAIASLLAGTLSAIASIWFIVEIMRLIGAFGVPLRSLMVIGAVGASHTVITGGFFALVACLVWPPRIGQSSPRNPLAFTTPVP